MTSSTLGLAAIIALQVTAAQAPTPAPELQVEVPSPLQITVQLGTDTDPKGRSRPPFDHQAVGIARAFPDTDKFVCDQAHVRMLTVKKLSETDQEVMLEASPTLLSSWPLQDVDLTVALLSPSGDVVGKQFWHNLTLGTWSRSYKPPKAVLHVPEAQWKSFFSDGKAPSIRITVAIQ